VEKLDKAYHIRKGVVYQLEYMCTSYQCQSPTIDPGRSAIFHRLKNEGKRELWRGTDLKLGQFESPVRHTP